MSPATSALNNIFEGWETYPVNLYESYSQHNLQSCHQLLSKRTERLFDEQHFSVQIETLNLVEGDEHQDSEMRRMTDYATTEAQLEAHLKVRNPLLDDQYRR